MVTAMFRLATSSGLSIIIGALACIINRPIMFTSFSRTRTGRTDLSICNGPRCVVVTMVRATVTFSVSRAGAPIVNTANTVVRKFITPMCGLSWRTIERIGLPEDMVAVAMAVAMGLLDVGVVTGTWIMWLVTRLVLL